MLDKRYFMQTDRASSGRASRGLLLAAVLACGGCASGADYERPRLAAPERFLGESAVQSRQATRPADPASWWRDFDDPLLAGLVEEALAQNLEIAQAIARVTQARAGLRAANAALLPSAQVTANAAYASQSIETPDRQSTRRNSSHTSH